MNKEKKSAVIECQSVYKVFGDNPQKLFTDNQTPTLDKSAIENGNYVVGVNNASLNVYRGEILVVMGLSGSGKSTLLRCISRLTEPTAGQIKIDGQDLLAMNNKELIELRRHKMGMVFQNFALLPHKTVLENIAFPLLIKGGKQKQSFERAHQMITLVGLEGRENSFPRELSGGQQQRVGIARSLAVEPDIWFLDEPFSALDPLIRREMQDEFLRLQSMLNKTIMFITHDFDEALRLADRIAIMYHGKIEQIDTPSNIVLNPKTDYVKKFTNEVPRQRILTAKSIMEAKKDKQTLSQVCVKDSAIIAEIAAQVLNETSAVAVIDENNKTIGVLNQKTVLKILFSDKNNHKKNTASI